jgi:dipeptidyl aminopeptidase/acylaminoacyl peptidase
MRLAHMMRATGGVRAHAAMLCVESEATPARLPNERTPSRLPSLAFVAAVLIGCRAARLDLRRGSAGRALQERSGEPSRHASPPSSQASALASVVDIREIALSPDGHTLAFATDRTGSFELFMLDLTRDGATPVQRTHADERVSGLVWSPDSSRLIFEMDHDGDERTDLYIARRDADTIEQLTATTTAEQDVRFSPDGRRLAIVSDPVRPFRFNVFVRDESGRSTQLTRAPINVQHPRWTRDGRTLVATRSGDDQRGDLLVIDVATGAIHEIAPPRRDGIAYAIDPLPDGRMLVLATNARGFAQLATLDLATGQSTFVGPDEWDVEDADVADDGTIVFSRNVHGVSEVSLMPHADPSATRTIARGGVVSGVSIDRAAHTVAILREASNHPAEVITVAVDGSRSGEIIRVAPDLAGVDIARLAVASVRTIASFDDTPVDVFTWSPPVARLGSPPPLVVHVHGGPNGQTRAAFSPMVQALARAGFFLASVNYRGSTGYGRAFEDLDNRDWGGGDLRDIVHVVHTLAREHVIDGARVGIYGGSYGGYMTLRAITAAPDEWSAAVDMFGMPDLVEDYRITGDRFGTWYVTEMGDPSQNVALYRDRSPIHALDRVRAPLLVLQGANDTNVPRVESDTVVNALRARGRTVEYVVYPDEGHGFTHRVHRIDSIERTVSFFARHLAPAIDH